MDPFIGMIVLFAGNFAPRGWALCDGQVLSIASNAALFSILGTTYGGDGRTTFGLPDLRGRVSIHPGNGPGLSNYRLGQRGGAENVTLNMDQIPEHNHAPVLHGHSGNANNTLPTNHVLANAREVTYSDQATDIQLNAAAITSNNVGDNQAHANIQPYLCVNYIIALTGTFPSRS